MLVFDHLFKKAWHERNNHGLDSGQKKPYLARAGVKVTVAEAGCRSRNPVVVLHPLAFMSRCSVSSFRPKGCMGRPMHAGHIMIPTLLQFPGAQVLLGQQYRTSWRLNRCEKGC